MRKAILGKIDKNVMTLYIVEMYKDITATNIFDMGGQRIIYGPMSWNITHQLLFFANPKLCNIYLLDEYSHELDFKKIPVKTLWQHRWMITANIKTNNNINKGVCRQEKYISPIHKNSLYNIFYMRMKSIIVRKSIYFQYNLF